MFFPIRSDGDSGCTDFCLISLNAFLLTVIRGTQDGDDGVAHWCLEIANRQAIGRCWI
jgi:hypothetical protein